MRKGLLFVVAALLVVALPLSAMAGTDVTKIQKQPLSFGYMDCWFDTSGVGKYYGYKYVCFKYTDLVEATYSETVRLKSNKDGTTDLGWNIVGRGVVEVIDMGGPNVSAAAAGINSQMFRLPVSEAIGKTVIETAHLQLEEVGQDDGNDAGCVVESPEFQTCNGEYAANLDYLMLHWKLNGNKYFFVKMTLKDSQFCMSDPTVPEGELCTSLR